VRIRPSKPPGCRNRRTTASLGGWRSDPPAVIEDICRAASSLHPIPISVGGMSPGRVRQVESR
jgi:hypothetical protein